MSSRPLRSAVRSRPARPRVELADLELKPSEYRKVHTGPLMEPRTLWLGLLFFAFATTLGAFAGWQVGTFWGALIPVPCAICFGVCLAGLFPAKFFNIDRR